MTRGQTTDEFADSHPSPHWAHYGGLPGDPGWVSDEAREIGDRDSLDAEALDDEAAAFGWEHHNTGYRQAIEDAAVRLTVAATAKLILHLYQHLGESTGGPLHVILDDGNVADEHIRDDGRDWYAYLFDGTFDRYAQAGDDVSDERKHAIRQTCELILTALRRMPELRRREAIAAAWRKLP